MSLRSDSDGVSEDSISSRGEPANRPKAGPQRDPEAGTSSSEEPAISSSEEEDEEDEEGPVPFWADPRGWLEIQMVSRDGNVPIAETNPPIDGDTRYLLDRPIDGIGVAAFRRDPTCPRGEPNHWAYVLRFEDDTGSILQMRPSKEVHYEYRHTRQHTEVFPGTLCLQTDPVPLENDGNCDYIRGTLRCN